MKSRPGSILAAMIAVLLPCTGMAKSPLDTLITAVRNDDLAAARVALTQVRDLNQRLADGSTPLAWAVDGQDRAMVELLLARGATPNASRGASSTPLMIACQFGDAVILNTLLSARADVKAARPDGVTPLSICAGNAPIAILERMIELGAEVDKPDDRGQTPLMWAAANGRVESIRRLVERGASINRHTANGFTPLFFALKSGVPEAPLVVLDAGGNADYVAPDGTSAVQLAMYQKDYDFAARMIRRGAELTSYDRNGNQLLHAAVLAGQASLVKLLIEKGANPNALTGTSKVVRRFEVNFKSGAYEPPPRTPLLLAAEQGSAEIMRMLLDAGADPTLRATDGTNVVLAAAAGGTLAALTLALELEPDANTTNVEGQTPLHLVLADGEGAELEAMMKLLAYKGARTNVKNRLGKTAADLAKDAQTDAKTAYANTFENQTMSYR